MAAKLAGTRPEVDHVLRAPDGVLVVLDHHQRVALGLELLEDIEQDAVVAVMQADGRLIEDVAHAAQVGAELRGKADALRLAARERRRRAVERQVAQPDVAEKAEARFQLRNEVAGDIFFSSTKRSFIEKAEKLFDRSR